MESPEAEFPEHLQASKRDSKGFISFSHPETGFPEHLQITYGITKYHLYEYARDVKASKKPEFRVEIQ